jgi:uncharacterized protein YceK
MKNLMGSFYIACLALVLSGCATIVSGTTQKINVTSNPSDAIAKIDNNLSAKTPTVFTLERRSDHTLELSKEGYKTTTVLLRRTFNGMATGNILIGGLIGTGIDAASGATNKIIPEKIDVILEEGEGYSDAPKFAAQKDQEFYDNYILKSEKNKIEKEKEREAAGAVKKVTETGADVSSGSLVSGTKTNFSPAK